MSEQEIRATIAEACGLSTKQDQIGGVFVYRHKNGTITATLPNYSRDLNAIHEAEGTLSPLDHQKFCLFLHKAIMGTMDNFDVNGTCNLECISRVVKAKACQRAEAFLRTIGKWKD